MSGIVAWFGVRVMLYAHTPEASSSGVVQPKWARLMDVG